MTVAVSLSRKIQFHEAIVGIIGMGYVGLPLAISCWTSGYPVVAFDNDPEKIDKLRAGDQYLSYLPDENYVAMTRHCRFSATLDLDRLSRCDVVVICVPTPLGKHAEPDLSFVKRTTEAISARLRPGQLIVLESTTYPGTTSVLMKGILERSGLECGSDFFLAYSPEREDPGNSKFHAQGIPKVVGGVGEAALDLAKEFYSRIFQKVIAVASADVAEAVKLTENIFRAVNIALVNELKIIYGAMGIDIWDVIEAAKTKPFGYMPFYPGPGLGGHCIPIDPFYLTWKAREFGLHTRFIELAGEINSAMPRHVVSSAANILNLKGDRGLKGANILLIGLAYKPDVNDIRESPALMIFELLEAQGARVSYHDPFVPTIPSTREHGTLAGRMSVELTATQVDASDLVLVVTDHRNVDYRLIAERAKLIVDTRNVFSRLGLSCDKVHKA